MNLLRKKLFKSTIQIELPFKTHKNGYSSYIKVTTQTYLSDSYCRVHQDSKPLLSIINASLNNVTTKTFCHKNTNVT